MCRLVLHNFANQCLRHVKSTVTRARGGVVPTPGITVIATPGAAVVAVMPGVRSTPGRLEPGDARGDAPGRGRG